jgi:hypothetical protein
MKQTAMQEANEKYLKSTAEEFYGWFWNNRERLLELEMKQIVEAHGDKLRKNQGVENYEYWFGGEEYYDKNFKKIN